MGVRKRWPRATAASRHDQGEPPILAEAHQLNGAEGRFAARLLARKYPLLHGIVVPVTHRVGRFKFGRTIHFELTPTDN
jgi:hypothetical protein